MKKEDMRTKRTKKALKTAINKLMETRTVEKISVTDICELAEVNRVTFYTHYNDKFELLEDLMNDIMQAIGQNNKKYYELYKTGDPIKDFTMVISHSIYKTCFENKKLLLVLEKYENKKLAEMMEKAVFNEGLKIIDTLKNTLEFNYPTNFIINFLMGGFSKLIFDYALKENELTEEKFFIYFDKLFYSILKSNLFFKTKM